jgi:DivIVA domain-containing protein
MALDRQSIEKRDFPIGRRGYDPEAVDAHLAEVANEVDELKLSARRHTESLATSASEQVRGIIEAAEASATEILRQSENDAREIRAEAAQEAQSARADATAQARDHVGRVSEATAAMLQRLNAMDSELSALIDGLRTGANRLNADLQLLESNFDGVRDSLGPRAQFENEPSPSAAGLAGVGGGSQISDGAAASAAEAAVDPDAVVDPGSEVAADIEGARLVALNMALNGTPRDETDRYLSENFELDDRATLLDEVYSSVQG